MTALLARGVLPALARKRARAGTGVAAFVVVILGLAVAVPALNLAVPPESPFHVPTYLVSLWGKYACYAMLALSIDLIWGYCGILSLGHGAFFALGGYAMGMYLMRQIGARGVYANPVLPDFMVFLNWDHLLYPRVVPGAPRRVAIYPTGP